jgi:carboxyl-terminal processing protease
MRRSHLDWPGGGIRALVSAALVVLFLLAAAHAEPLSIKERARIFEQVWQLVRDRYYDPSFHGLDWDGIGERYRVRLPAAHSDDEFYSLLKQMTGELHDAHTRFRTPAERKRAARRVATTTGVLIGEVEGAPTVINVEPDSEAARSGVEPGMVLVSVNGEPVAKRLAEVRKQVGTSSTDRASDLLSYYRLLTGEPQTLVRLSFARPDGSPLDVVLKRHVVSLAPLVSTRVLSAGIVYMRIKMFDEQSAKQTRAALKKARHAPGLIIDLRGNPGGNFRGVLKIADDFYSHRVSFGRVVARSGKPPSFFLRLFGVPSELEAGRPGRQVYAGPVVILINEGSGSAAELFAAGMQENGRATVVGRQSCGCVLGSVAHKVKGGGEVDISEFAITTAKGRRLEGTGVVPAVTVPLTLGSLRQHRDATLERAEAMLQSRE